MERGVQLGLGEGPIKSGSNIPTPYTLTTVRFLCQLYSWQLRMTCILIYKGAVSHRAHGACKKYLFQFLSTAKASSMMSIYEKFNKVLAFHFFVTAPFSEARETHRYLKKQLGIVRAWGRG